MREKPEQPTKADPSEIPAVKEATKPENAIPAKAPPEQKQKMGERMKRFKEAVDVRVPGETPEQRNARLEKLRDSLFDGGGCECNGTGMITKRGTFVRSDGREIPNTSWVARCDCPYGQAKSAPSDVDAGEAVTDEDGLDGAFE